MKQHIGIAISGGVDSTAAALILKKKSRITGFFMDLGQPDFILQKQRVEEIADRIGCHLHILDLKDQFSHLVKNYFTKSYFAGKTPNPCIICNRDIKFGLFLDSILAAGVDLAATGHYARIEKIDDVPALLTGLDPFKDQSYFLCRVDPDRFKKIVFPLGSRRKEEIYSFVEEEGFSCFKGKESQDVCFLENSNSAAFLSAQPDAPDQNGPILTAEGKVLGTHKGLFRYTIGQRRGLGLPDATPWYVTGINAADNSLIVGKKDDLSAREAIAVSPHWLTPQSPEIGSNYTVRIRYSHPGAEAQITHIDDNCFKLLFKEPQRAVAPGQFAVLYEGERVIGSGEISKKQ